MGQRIKLLGTLEITENGRPTPLMKSRRGCALLAYLITTGQHQRREVVADLLWESASTSHSLQRLRDLLRRVRPLLPHLVVTRSHLSYHPPPEQEIDYLAYQQGTVHAADSAALDKALALYHGELLAQFYLPDAPAFNEWLAVTREQLRQQVNDHARRLCRLYAEQRAWTKGVAAARRWLALDPLHEAAWRWLMRLLSGQGDFAAALDQYGECRRLLWETLGVEPALLTRKLAWQIQEEAQSQPTVPALPAADELPPPGLLPAQAVVPYHRNALFTGRQADLLAMARHLLPVDAPGLPRTLAMTGMGGLGKTQLALEYVYRYGRYYPGGVFWISFAQPENIEAAIIATGDQQGLDLYPATGKLTQAQKVARVLQAWREPLARLLIFDNCETVALLRQWLPISGGCSILLTSRRGQWPKELPLVERPLAVLPRADSVRLIRQLADRVTAAEAAAIAAELGDLPLALQLSGHYLAQNDRLAPADYLVQLRKTSPLQHASLQGEFMHYAPTGHELHVARTFALSLARQEFANPADRLARRLLARAACFAPGEPIPRTLLVTTLTDGRLAEEVFSVESGWQRLTALGFLKPEGGETGVLHRLLALFTWELAENGEMAAAAAAVAQTLIDRLHSYRQKHHSLGTLPFASAHLRYVARTLPEVPPQQRAELIYLLGVHLRQAAVYAEAESCLREARQLFTDLLGTEHPRTADVIAEMGLLLFDTGQYEAVFAHYEEALAIRKKVLGIAHPDTARSLNNLGAIHLRVGAYEKGRPYLEQALAVREETLGPEHPQTTQSLNNLGVLHDWQGDTARAQHYFERVLAIRERQLGADHLLTAVTLNNLGDLLSRRQEYAVGRPLLERAIAIRKQQLGAQHPLTLASMANLGKSLLGSGHYAAAQTMLTEAATAAETALSPDHPIIARIQNRLGELFTITGHYAEALPHLEKALSLRQTLLGDTHPDTDYSRICLGELCRAMGETDRAVSLFRQALKNLTQSLSPDHEDVQRARRNLAAL